MSFASLLNRRFAFHRRSALIVAAATLAASHSAAITPAVPYAVEVEMSGSGTAGTITVTGTVSGSAGQTQVLTFAATGKQATTKIFDKSTTVTITKTGTWTGTWTITVRAINRDGSQIKALSAISSATSWPGRISRTSGSWQVGQSGSHESESSTLFLAYSTVWTPREGDEAVDSLSGERWKLLAIPTIDDMASPHHYEARVARAEE